MATWKALAIGDVHWTALNPVARLDNFKEALTAKLRECWEIAEREQVNAIIQTGDLLHSTGIVYSTLAELIWVLRVAPAPIYAIAGNHDLWGGTPASLYRTPIGFLFDLHIIRQLSRSGGGDDHVILSGVHYDPSVDEGFYPYVLDNPPGPHQVQIHVTHGMLVDKPIPARHTLINALRGQRLPHVLVNGHYHLGTGVRKIEGHDGRPCYVVNPGALARLTAAVEEMERPVQVALIEVDGTDVDVRLIRLTSAKPGNEVLSREHLEAQASREARRAEFLELLAGATAAQARDLAEMTRVIADEKGLPPEVRDEALQRLAIAQEAEARPA